MNKMNIRLITGLFLLAGIVAQFSAEAAVKLPALIGNNMVLQQNAQINVWGWADAGEKVTINASWQSTPATAIAAHDGTWKTTIKTPAAGGPFKMTITGRDYSINIENVMVGEVWVCSGQSNMDFTMRGLGGWKHYKPEVCSEVASGAYAGVRMFTVQKDTSAVPLINVKETGLRPIPQLLMISALQPGSSAHT
jgi:sialate O-acetylesterase